MQGTYVQLKSLQCCPVASGDGRQHPQHLLNHTVQVAQAAQLLQADVRGAATALPCRCLELGASARTALGEGGLWQGVGLGGTFLRWAQRLALVVVSIFGRRAEKWLLAVPALGSQGVWAGSHRAVLTLLVQLMGRQLLPYFFNH